MKKFFLLTGSIIIAGNLLLAQDEKRNTGFYSAIEVRYLKSLSADGDYVSYPAEHWKLYGKSLRFYFGYFLNPHVSAGIGFGADRYEEPGANTIPFFVDLRGYLKDRKNTPFVFLETGYSVKFSEAMEKGYLLDTGLGYKLFVSKRLCLYGSVGYNYKYFPEWWQYTTDSSPAPGTETYKWAYLKRHSISFSMGIHF